MDAARAGRGQVVLGGQVLRECRQKRVPPLVASGGRFVL